MKMGLKLLAVIVAAQIPSGCCGCGGKSDDYLCESVMKTTADEHFSIGTNKDKNEARESAVWGSCYQYCNYEDPFTYQAWKEWKDTEDGQSSRMGKIAEVDLYAGDVRDGCVESCLVTVESGGSAVKVECSPPSKHKKCTATIEYKGGTYTASDKGEHPEYHSKRIACRNYCLQDNDDLQLLYQEWAASEAGKDSPWDTKEKALEHSQMLTDDLNLCQSDCLVDILFGKVDVKYDCQ